MFSLLPLINYRTGGYTGHGHGFVVRNDNSSFTFRESQSCSRRRPLSQIQASLTATPCPPPSRISWRPSAWCLMTATERWTWAPASRASCRAASTSWATSLSPRPWGSARVRPGQGEDCLSTISVKIRVMLTSTKHRNYIILPVTCPFIEE